MIHRIFFPVTQSSNCVLLIVSVVVIILCYALIGVWFSKNMVIYFMLVFSSNKVLGHACLYGEYLSLKDSGVVSQRVVFPPPGVGGGKGTRLGRGTSYTYKFFTTLDRNPLLFK